MSAVLPDDEPTPADLDAIADGLEDHTPLDLRALLEELEPTRVIPAGKGTATLAGIMDKLQPRVRTADDGWGIMVCATHPDPELWWPKYRGGRPPRNPQSALRAQELKALRVCGSCPSRMACLREAIEHDEPTEVTFGAGIWGGVIPRDRAVIRDALTAAGDSAHLLWNMLEDGRDAGELADTLRDAATETAA